MDGNTVRKFSIGLSGIIAAVGGIQQSDLWQFFPPSIQGGVIMVLGVANLILHSIPDNKGSNVK